MIDLSKFGSLFVLLFILQAGCVQAQTEKAYRHKGKHAQPVKPYISQTELEDISMGGRMASGKSVGGTGRKSSERRVKFRDILTVESTDEITRRLGEPKSTDYTRFPEVDHIEYEVSYTYEGITLWYKKVNNKIKLKTISVTSEDWFLKVGGIRLRPGMRTDSLSATVRQAIDDGVSVLRVVGPNTTEKRNLEKAIRETRTKISIILDKDNKSVGEVNLNRVVI